MTALAVAPRTASILAVGSELLGTTRLDTNSLFLTGRMDALGISTVRKVCVGDDWDDLVAEISAALERAPLLVTSGGLGPTGDDRTKEAVAKVFGLSLVRDDGLLLRLKERFRKRGFEMPEVNAKQADVIEGATILVNRRGSAPGFLLEQGGRIAVLLPGVPHELKAMWDDAVAPLLARTAAEGLYRRVLKIAAIPESVVETLIKPVYAAYPDVPITILAAPGEVQLHFAARGTEGEALAVLGRIESDFHKALASEIFGRDEDTLEGVVGDLLRLRQKSLALAESCTGGLLAGRLTDIAGSSDYFFGSAVTYANTAKAELVGVSAATLERFGAVSEETAREMALGARRRFGSSIGLSVTGIAGPGGGTPDKPVGTVHYALDDADGTRLHRRLLMPGDRALVRRWSTSAALSMLRHHLLGTTGGRP